MIIRKQLEDIGFGSWTKGSHELYFDDDVMYNIKEQRLYHADEVYGDDEPLCVVKDIEELRDLVYSYFKVEI